MAILDAWLFMYIPTRMVITYVHIWDLLWRDSHGSVPQVISDLRASFLISKSSSKTCNWFGQELHNLPWSYYAWLCPIWRSFHQSVKGDYCNENQGPTYHTTWQLYNYNGCLCLLFLDVYSVCYLAIRDAFCDWFTNCNFTNFRILLFFSIERLTP